MRSFIPHLPRNSIRRHRLLAALSAWRELCIVQIVAPAGAGKTTLAHAWLQSLDALPANERPHTAWLPLAPADADLSLFVERLTACMPQSEGVDAFALDPAAAPLAVAAALRTWISRVIGRVPLVLVLDDVHLLPPGPAFDLLQCLLDPNDDQLHFCIVSRIPLEFDFSRAQLAGCMLSLNFEDLCFDRDEFGAFMQLTQRMPLPTEHLALLEQSSGGWPAILRLIVQSLPATQLASLDELRRAGSTEIRRYLEKSVFQSRPDLLTLLTDLAFLPTFDAELAAAAADRTVEECRDSIERAVALTGLVGAAAAPSTRRGGAWLRIHPQLRRLLLPHFLQQYGERRASAFRRRAAAHLAHYGDLDAALALLLPAASPDAQPSLPPDPETAADLLTECGRAAILRGEIAGLHAWIARIPDALVRSRPRVALDAVWCTLHLLDPQIGAQLARAREAIQSVPPDDLLRTELATLTAFAAVVSGSDSAAVLSAAMALPCEPNSLVDGYRRILHGFTLDNEPRTLEDRLREVAEGSAIFRRHGHARGLLDAAVCAQWIAGRHADAGYMLETSAQVQRLLNEVGMENSTYGMYSDLYSAQAHYLVDQIAEARTLLQELLRSSDAAAADSVSNYHAHVRLQMCDIAEGRPILYFDPIEDSRRWTSAAKGTSPILVAHTAYMRALRDLHLEFRTPSEENCAAFGRTFETLSPRDARPIRLAVLVSTVLSGRCDDDVLTHVRDLVDDSCRIRHHFVEYYARALLVTVLQARTENDQAVTALQSLLERVERAHVIRVVLDHAPTLLPLLKRIDTPYADKLVRRITMAPQHASPSTSPFGLTDAEVRVLQLLGRKYGTQRIADDLRLSVATVRTHLRNAFRKMRVHNRSEAIDVAKEVGLL